MRTKCNGDEEHWVEYDAEKNELLDNQTIDSKSWPVSSTLATSVISLAQSHIGEQYEDSSTCSTEYDISCNIYCIEIVN